MRVGIARPCLCGLPQLRIVRMRRSSTAVSTSCCMTGERLVFCRESPNQLQRDRRANCERELQLRVWLIHAARVADFRLHERRQPKLPKRVSRLLPSTKKVDHGDLTWRRRFDVDVDSFPLGLNGKSGGPKMASTTTTISCIVQINNPFTAKVHYLFTDTVLDRKIFVAYCTH
jgi:hypothetical protein